MKMNGADIRKQEFPVRLRGYDKLDVDAFMHLAADSVDELLRRNGEIEGRCAEMSGQIEGLKKREEELQKTLTAVSELREEAAKRTQLLVRQAETEAKRILAEAKEEGKKTRQEAADHLHRLRRETSEVEYMRDKIVRELADLLRSHVGFLENEGERLGLDLSPIGREEGGKVIELSQKSEVERK